MTSRSITYLIVFQGDLEISASACCTCAQRSAVQISLRAVGAVSVIDCLPLWLQDLRQRLLHLRTNRHSSVQLRAVLMTNRPPGRLRQRLLHLCTHEGEVSEVQISRE